MPVIGRKIVFYQNMTEVHYRKAGTVP